MYAHGDKQYTCITQVLLSFSANAHALCNMPLTALNALSPFPLSGNTYDTMLRCRGLFPLIGFYGVRTYCKGGFLMRSLASYHSPFQNVLPLALSHRHLVCCTVKPTQSFPLLWGVFGSSFLASKTYSLSPILLCGYCWEAFYTP